MEKKFISLSDKIFKRYRYRDDIISFWSGDERELANFISRINTVHPTLKFTHEWSKTEINFLDLTLYKGERFNNTQILDIKCFSKPCYTFQYLSRDSSHPNACFSGMVKGEAIRYIRNSSSETEYEKKLDFFISKLLTRGYKKFEVLNCLADISYKRRNIYLEDVPKYEIPLVFCTHHFPQRSNAQNKKALIKNWHYISEKLENNSNKKTKTKTKTKNKKQKNGWNLPLPPYTCIKTHSKPSRRTSFQSKDHSNPKLIYIFDSEHAKYRWFELSNRILSYVSYTKRLVRSVRRNLNALLNHYFMTCFLLNSQAPVKTF